MSSLIDFYGDDRNGIALNLMALETDHFHTMVYSKKIIEECSSLYNKSIVVDVSKYEPEIYIYNVLDRKSVKYQPHLNLCDYGFPKELINITNIFLSKSISLKYLNSDDFTAFLKALKTYYDLVIINSGFLFEKFNLIYLLKAVDVNVLNVFQGVTRTSIVEEMISKYSDVFSKTTIINIVSERV